MIIAEQRPHPRPLPEGEGVWRGAWRVLLRLKLALVDRHRYERVVLENVQGTIVLVLPNVFNPKLLRSGEFLVRQLNRAELVPRGSRVLDLGSGSGVAGIAAAKRGCRVVAVDINPAAVRCTRINALINDVDIDIRQGDLFAPVLQERFDVVLFNPPYYRGVPRDALDQAWRATDVIERFASELSDHLEAAGHALLVLSSDGDGGEFLGALERSGFAHEVVAERDFVNEVMRVHVVRRC